LTEGEKLVSESVLLVSTLSLITELAVLGLLTFGYFAKRMKNYRQHGITMTTALVLHLITIFSWMAMSFIRYFSAGSVDYGSLSVLASFAHATFGIIAASLGVWLVASWHLQTDVQKCFARKRIMLTTITFWVTAILLGIVLYLAVVFS
jgi:uncharacterized membrane protein YozB (DUF420 family)